MAQFGTPNKSAQGEHVITPSKPGAVRRLDEVSSSLFIANKRRKIPGGKKHTVIQTDSSEEEKSEIYQPISTYNTVIYESKLGPPPDPEESWGLSSKKTFLSHQGNKDVYEFITKNFIVPANFDTSLEYGARSGTCHEERLVRAYQHTLLKLKTKSDASLDTASSWKMCTECSEMGHFDEDCEQVFSRSSKTM